MFSLKTIDIFSIVCAGIALRAIISLHSYSGEKTPPRYGDFEAQRHWQEITTKTPVALWYTNTTDNDLQYWGLDYPPLTAYHSYGLGVVAGKINENFVKLHDSRGIETPEHKSFMRHSVLLADVCIFVPAMLSLGYALQQLVGLDMLLPFVTVALLFPGQMLIDNGHFQYNNISLGLAALAITCILRKRFFWAAACFSLALNYKQMELYHSLPIFVIMLRHCFEAKRWEFS